MSEDRNDGRHSSRLPKVRSTRKAKFVIGFLHGYMNVPESVVAGDRFLLPIYTMPSIRDALVDGTIRPKNLIFQHTGYDEDKAIIFQLVDVDIK
jgi:hypothetical protein